MHYSIDKIHNIQQLRELFPNGKADDRNWCVLSTSGVHGTHITLDILQRYFDDREKFIKVENGGELFYPKITVFVFMPRMVHVKYGEILIEKRDIPWLRGLVSSSLEFMAATQKGNILKESTNEDKSL